MALLIKTDGSESTVVPKQGSRFSLEELWLHVGGFLQMLELRTGRLLLLDEEGKNRPRNARATLLGRTAGIANDDYVVGDVLICDESELPKDD